MVSLIFGLLALAADVVSFFNLIPGVNTGWLSLAGFVLAIIAVATGSSILKSDPKDKNARAGKAIGTVCIVLAVLGVVVWLVFLTSCLGAAACAAGSCAAL